MHEHRQKVPPARLRPWTCITTSRHTYRPEPPRPIRTCSQPPVHDHGKFILRRVGPGRPAPSFVLSRARVASSGSTGMASGATKVTGTTIRHMLVRSRFRKHGPTSRITDTAVKRTRYPGGSRSTRPSGDWDTFSNVSSNPALKQGVTPAPDPWIAPVNAASTLMWVSRAVAVWRRLILNAPCPASCRFSRATRCLFPSVIAIG